MASAQQAAEIKVIEIRKKQETDNLVRALLDMGEAMIGSGAEIYRAEDTLRRIAKAYGASDCEVFIITSSIVITLELPQEHPRTRTRRIRKPVENDFTKLEDLNELLRVQARKDGGSFSDISLLRQRFVSSLPEIFWMRWQRALSELSFSGCRSAWGRFA